METMRSDGVRGGIVDRGRSGSDRATRPVSFPRKGVETMNEMRKIRGQTDAGGGDDPQGRLAEGQRSGVVARWPVPRWPSWSVRSGAWDAGPVASLLRDGEVNVVRGGSSWSGSIGVPPSRHERGPRTPASRPSRSRHCALYVSSASALAVVRDGSSWPGSIGVPRSIGVSCRGRVICRLP